MTVHKNATMCTYMHTHTTQFDIPHK